MRNATRVRVVIGIVSILLALVSTAEARPRRRPRNPPPETEPAEPAPEAIPETAAPATTPPATGTPPAPTTGTPASTPATTPVAPAPVPTPTPASPEALDFRDPPVLPDLAVVRDEIDTIMDELVETRARVAAVGRELFDTRIRIRVYVNSGRLDAGVTLSVRLDGLAVYSAEPGDDDEGTQIFEGYAAPGPHVLQIVTERRAREDDDYRASQSDSFRFELARGKMNDVSVSLDDRSDIAEDFEEEGEGTFDLRTRIRVRALDIERATP